jgi:hypothetical protein
MSYSLSAPQFGGEHFGLWHEAQVRETHGYFRSWGWTGCAIRLPATAALDPIQT